MRPIKVWDLPVRLFHWAIVVLIFFSWGTQELNYMDWHGTEWLRDPVALAVPCDVGLRRQVTQPDSRVSSGGPSAAWRHLAHLRRPEPDREIGHNAAGGWMVLVMLALIGAQAGTGLFANDDANTGGATDASGR